MSERFEGGCHCGAVRFAVTVERLRALECNCSICTKKGFLHVIVDGAAFTQLAGEDSMSDYRFGTMTARHTFCSRCGICAFYTPRSHPQGVDVNLRCFDSPEAIARFEVEPFDGREWEQNVGSIR